MGGEVETATTRCTQCRTEFTEAQLASANACPKCGTDSLPMAIADDVTIKVNWHELRILGIWATNWSEKCGEGAQKSLRSILGVIRAQHPERPGLTLDDDLQEVADAFGDVHVIKESGMIIVRGRKPS